MGGVELVVSSPHRQVPCCPTRTAALPLQRSLNAAPCAGKMLLGWASRAQGSPQPLALPSPPCPGTVIFGSLTGTKTYLDCFQADSQLNSCSGGIFSAHPKKGRTKQNETKKTLSGSEPKPKSSCADTGACSPSVALPGGNLHPQTLAHTHSPSPVPTPAPTLAQLQ